MPFLPGSLSGYQAGAIALAQPAGPTAPASTSAYKMQGLAATFTPNVSGNVVAIFTATVNASATTVGNGINLQPYVGQIVGSNVAPANAAAIPGNANQIGNTVTFATGVTLTTAADLFQPITVIGLAKALIPGQQYWFDLAAESVTTASDNALVNVTVILFEVA